MFLDDPRPFTYYCGRGWLSILDKLCARLEAYGFSGKCVQIKEKFGGLRFYVSGGETDHRMRLAIEAAEYESLVTCEGCGSPGWADGDIWIQTLCEAHHRKKNGQD